MQSDLNKRLADISAQRSNATENVYSLEAGRRDAANSLLAQTQQYGLTQAEIDAGIDRAAREAAEQKAIADKAAADKAAADKAAADKAAADKAAADKAAADKAAADKAVADKAAAARAKGIAQAKAARKPEF